MRRCSVELRLSLRGFAIGDDSATSATRMAQKMVLPARHARPPRGIVRRSSRVLFCAVYAIRSADMRYAGFRLMVAVEFYCSPVADDP